MDEIYVAVDNDPTSSADSTQDEWVARLRLINMGLRAWERQDVSWNELWTLYTHATAVTTSSSYIMAATDFRFMPGSYLQFKDSNGNYQYMDIIKPDVAQQNIKVGARKAWITGNASAGYTINFTFTPTVTDQLIGMSMSLYYYKSAKKMALATDIPEMGDPSCLVSYVAAKKNLFNGRSGIAQDYLSDWQESMDNMRIRNEMTIPYGDNRIPDGDIVRDGDSFGL